MGIFRINILPEFLLIRSIQEQQEPHERLRGAITRKMGVETGKFFEYWVKN
jgi:hypothetical protein